jgi:hypothetical protein
MRHLILSLSAVAIIGCAHKTKVVDEAALKDSYAKLEEAHKETDRVLKELNRSVKKADKQLDKAGQLAE